MFDFGSKCDGKQMDNLAEYIMNRRENEELKQKGEQNEEPEGV